MLRPRAEARATQLLAEGGVDVERRIVVVLAGARGFRREADNRRVDFPDNPVQEAQGHNEERIFAGVWNAGKV